jgi:transcriptional regulator with XRE-family HTH domain
LVIFLSFKTHNEIIFSILRTLMKSTSNFMTPPLTPEAMEARLISRLGALREERKLSLETVSERTGISRATLSRLERGESSPTAATLGRLCAVYGCTISHLMAEVETEQRLLMRRKDQPIWRDPQSGFLRRVVSPPVPGLRGEMIEGKLPPGASIDYGNPLPDDIERHLIVLGGILNLTENGTRHQLKPGDCLRIPKNGASHFRAHGPVAARYILVAIRP